MKNRCIDVFSSGVRYSVFIDDDGNYTLERENLVVGCSAKSEPISANCAFAILTALDNGKKMKEREIRRVLGIKEK